MSSAPPSDDSPIEIEISLEDAELDLHTVEVDSADLPLEFSVGGVIRDIDTDVLEELEGYDLKPTAVRFQLLKNRE